MIVVAGTVVTAMALMGVPVLNAHADYTGYSGAPGTMGTCASSCHGQGSGTIVVGGFPASYTPGGSYLITVKHSGGAKIRNFNASVRVASGSQNAGTLTAGYNTSTYDAGPTEPLGVHLTAATRDSGKFTWTAPDPGVGPVKLYLGGMQNTTNDPDGQNSSIVLNATEATAVKDDRRTVIRPLRLDIENRIVSDYLVFRAAAPTSAALRLRVLDLSGRSVAAIEIPQTEHSRALVWMPVDRRGNRLSAGNYLLSLAFGRRRLTRQFTLVK